MIPSIANIRKAIYCLNKRIDQLEGGEYSSTVTQLSNKVAALESLLDDDAQNPTAAIDKFNEIVAFLNSIDNTETLQELLRDAIQQSYQQNYVTVSTYANLPTTGSADTIYRVSNYNGSTNQIDTTSYSEYVWDNSDYTLLCVKSQIGEVFDISEYHGGQTYLNLEAALDSNNGGGVPPSLQKGGMSVKYVCTSDNTYVQYFCNSQTFTTNVIYWEKINTEHEVSANIDNLNNLINGSEYQFTDGYYYRTQAGEVRQDNSFTMCTLQVYEGQTIIITGDKSTSGATNLYVLIPFDGSATILSEINSASNLSYTVPKSGLMYINSYKNLPHSVKPYSPLISEIEGDIAELQGDVSKAGKPLSFFRVKELFNNYGYIASDGTVHPELASFKYTDLIPIIGKSPITTYGYTTSQACSIIAFYDSNKEFISTINQTVTVSGITVAVSDIPSNAKYIRSTALFESVSDESYIFMATSHGLSENIRENSDNIASIVSGNSIFTYHGYIIPADGTPQPYEDFRATDYIPIDGNACPIVLKYYTTSGGTAQVAFYDRNKTHISSISGTNLPYSGRVISTSEIPANAKYIRCSALASSLNRWSMVLSTNITQLMNKLTEASEFINPYANKTCLYIGDSISTSNLYYWKGYVENLYALSYARDLENQLWPANGGISLCPPQTESESLTEKSIWYRCAENRMSIYDFDVISLFGGTNDMWGDGYEGVVLGTTDDIPYVDDADSFSTPANYTDVWTDDLTFAQCMMGCIEMLQRDFPTKEIIICSVMPCGGNYGNQLDANNVRMSERMAILQGLIAKKYNLKFIPFYWDMRNVLNVNVFSIDGCHPNDYQARRMCGVMKTSLFL